MPNIVESSDPIPLRGYTIYASDLPVIDEHLGGRTYFVYFQRGRSVPHEAKDLTRLLHRDIDGFDLLGENATFSLTRNGRGSRCAVSVSGTDVGAVLDVLAVLTPRRIAWVPWRAYDCRFVKHNRDEVSKHRWTQAGVIVGLLGLVTPLLIWLAA